MASEAGTWRGAQEHVGLGARPIEPPVVVTSVWHPDNDLVNHPPHYRAGGIELIDVIEAFGLGFRLGNAVKYIFRADRKGEAPVQDLKKAVWYLQREIQKREETP